MEQEYLRYYQKYQETGGMNKIMNFGKSIAATVFKKSNDQILNELDSKLNQYNNAKKIIDSYPTALSTLVNSLKANANALGDNSDLKVFTDLQTLVNQTIELKTTKSITDQELIEATSYLKQVQTQFQDSINNPKTSPTIRGSLENANKKIADLKLPTI
jgi:DNA integrity scanning protein DisA with diadenylate cyclase activity